MRKLLSRIRLALARFLCPIYPVIVHNVDIELPSVIGEIDLDIEVEITAADCL